MKSSHADFLTKHRSVHFVGIGGIGVSALARLFRRYGYIVSGSDILHFSDEGFLRAQGIHITIGHPPLAEGVDMLVYSPAVPKDDPERTEARTRGIHEFSYPQALGMLMQGRYGIAVSGTNGKTTTTALLGLMLQEGGLDPTVVVGGMIPLWGGNMRIGAGVEFVAEGCEYRRHMLMLHPKMIVLTNIALDHLDYYNGIDDIESAFAEYIRMLPADGILVYNADDPRTVEVSTKNCSARMISFSLGTSSFLHTDYGAGEVHHKDGAQRFEVHHQGKILGTLATPLPGAFNRANILAAFAAAYSRGVSFDAIARAVTTFLGATRRFERVGTYHGAPVISDYAHHPDAVLGTIKAARECFPGRQVIVVFQPHQTDRTVKLFGGFVDALVTADRVVLAEIYRVVGREENNTYANMSSSALVDAINERAGDRAAYASTLTEAEVRISGMDVSQSVLLIMGAGDIDALARTLVVS
ncbi:MAG: UDP-N-acetylmuramate--L-alanine ligase [Minisyncoccota bacterium]